MEDEKNNTGQNLGIAALITAIVTFVLAVIPCVGLMAIIPGIIAIVLASVGLSQAAKSESPRGLLIAGLIIAIVATMISFSQVFIAGKIAEGADHWQNKVEEIFEDVQDEVLQDLEDANVSIKIESGDDKIEINTSAGKKNKIEELEELEGENTGVADTLE